MTDTKQLPHLIKLLDDDSEDVRRSVRLTLQTFGPALREEICKLNIALSSLQKESLECVYFKHKVDRLTEHWPTWFSIKNEYEKLETALSLISDFMGDFENHISLSDELDALTELYKERHDDINPFFLAKFLFSEYGMKGDEENYYNPENNNLVYVIKHKKGIPISLSAVYILVGERLGLDIRGCHFPGHFLCRLDIGGNQVFIDCFSQGQIIHQEDIIRVQDTRLEGIEAILREDVSAEVMIRRCLANIIRAYHLSEDETFSPIIGELFKQLDLMIYDRDLIEMTPESIIASEPLLFRAGQVVRHVKYGYIGVIVDYDDHCQSSDGWYYGNQTQPDRYQPWYHVLVDGTDQVTYVAQSNLMESRDTKKIEHPLLNYFFTETQEGKYIRNGNPWPDTDF